MQSDSVSFAVMRMISFSDSERNTSPSHNDQLENTLSDTGDDDAMIEDGNDDNNETTGELAKANLTHQYHQRF